MSSDMTDYPGPPFELHGVRCVSWIDGSGLFRARREQVAEDSEETVVTGTTFAEVREAMNKIILTRRARLSVRFSALDATRSKVRNGTVTGLHAGNGNKLVAWDDGGAREQITGGGYLLFLPLLTFDQARELEKLHAASRAADRAYREKVREITGGSALGGGWQLDNEVKKAVNAAEGKGS